ncbi:glycosyltransferase family 4 protein [Panacibacter ginsenosidivorans]|uniref:Glycosyltransferase family 4 protein n=1 Tax=Panacibacter ginsenosidivorans TaxID=1813871 RepID=A0A5B8V7C4_9BACT|nr:glycosyltransferase family 4 protein [Panacibacter ginsenosidivorans]QEC66681.1 glycosyltransferase family 4 protein [Panacibacter ginsenosidivorans]
MKIAVLAPVAWRTPPRHYGPWEQVAYNITEGLVKRGFDVTLFATKDSLTSAKYDGVIERGYEEDKDSDAKVSECLHISHLMETANEYDIIHNHFDFLPLTYSNLIRTPIITTIHGFSSEKIIPVYKKYNATNYYISISDADRNNELHYVDTIYHGIEESLFSFKEIPADYLLYFGRIHPDKGTYDAIQIAKTVNKKLIIAGIVQDNKYYKEKIEPLIDHEQIQFIGHAGPEKRNELLGSALALLHPIYFKEPFGLSVAEAMFCGTPVIAYNKGSMAELIENKISGYLVNNMSEAIDAIKDLPNIKRRECADYARDKFSYKKMIDKYINAYEYALAHPLK